MTRAAFGFAVMMVFWLTVGIVQVPAQTIGAERLDDVVTGVLGEYTRSGTADGEATGTLRPSISCESITATEVQKACFNADKAYFEYYVFGLNHRQTVFEFQSISTRLIFATVLGLVGIGVWFAWKQFERDKDKPATESTLELTGKGLKVTSSVLGVIILTLSLGFFYLYLVYVYPIQETL
ncbi:MAG: hypothetical protein AAF479_06050 [Pseudomonadota bacterium]